jgi:hypothetical protein
MGILTDLAVSILGPAVTLAGFKTKDKQGSPVWTWNVGAIAASASVSIDPGKQFPASRAWAPLDSIVVTNNDVVDVLLTINGTETYYIPAGTIQPVSGDIGLNHLTITNLNAGTAVTAGAIYANLQKAPKDINDLARRMM